MIELLLLLTLKHFIIDSLLQTPYQYLNKGKFLHPGGLIHAGLHGIGTILCFLKYPIEIISILGILDMVIHYIIDYFKVNISNSFKWAEYIKGSNDSDSYLKINYNNYFVILVLDQCLHFTTYIILIWLVFNKLN